MTERVRFSLPSLHQFFKKFGHLSTACLGVFDNQAECAHNAIVFDALGHEPQRIEEALAAMRSTAASFFCSRAGRLALDASGTGLGLFNERNARIVSTLEKTAAEVGRSMAQVALNWVVNRPGVAAAIVGASKLDQLEDNIASLDFELAVEQRAALDAASATEAPYPYSLFADDYQAGILNTGSSVGDKPKTYRSDSFLPKVADYVFGQPKNQK